MTQDSMNPMDPMAAIDEARAAAGHGSALLLDRLVQAAGGRAGTEAVFGAPIERGEVTVVPVARVRWGAGGGGGDSTVEGASGSGGGAGVIADPIGYLEITPSGAAFREIAKPFSNPLTILAAAIAASIVIRAIVRLVR